MFSFLVILSLASENHTFMLPKSMVPASFAPLFVSTGQIRLIGFKENTKDLKANLMVLLNNKFLKIDVIRENPDVHHSFRANVEEINEIPFSTDNDLEFSIAQHFSKNLAHFAVYVIRAESPLNAQTNNNNNNNIVAKGKNWLAIKFYDYLNNEDAAYQIAIRVLSIFSDIFNYQLHFQPRASILNTHVSINVFQAGSYDSASVIRSSINDLCTLNISIHHIDPKIFNALCSVCSDTNCALSWIKRIPEYIDSINSNALPVFLMPSVCSYQYASNDVAFAPNKMDTALKSIIRKSLFGVETKPQSEPFFEIIAQRNMAVFPLESLVEQISKPVEEMLELSQYNSVVIPQKVLEVVDGRYANFTKIQRHLTHDILELGIKVAKEHWDQLNEITQSILFVWGTFNDNIKRKRMCVGNLLDYTQSPWFFTRPSFFCFLSLVTSALLFKFVFTHMKPKQVVDTLLSEVPGL